MPARTYNDFTSNKRKMHPDMKCDSGRDRYCYFEQPCSTIPDFGLRLEFEMVDHHSRTLFRSIHID